MLSLQVKPINNAQDAAHYYFAKDNYYFTSELSTQWQGESSLRLGLEGSVKQDDLMRVLTGALPNGAVIGRQTAAGELKHRGGYDLTFSAPKSVSYLALVGGHKELIEMHNQAVSKVLVTIEQHAAEARKQGKTGMEYEKTDNLSFATINHDTSRERDPHLHTHALLMNLTERSDGKWRALASDISRNHGTMEWVMDNKIFLGLIYRSELAMSLKEMGLEVAHTGDQHGLFEIKYFNTDLLTFVSKRRTQIEDRVSTMQFDTVKAYDRATLDTRKSKQVSNSDELQQHWRQESALFGVNPDSYLRELQMMTLVSRTAGTGCNTSGHAKEAVQDAMVHLAAGRLSFGFNELLQASLQLSIGDCGLDALVHEIELAVQSKTLIALDAKESQFTTAALIEQERALVHKLGSMRAQQRGISADKLHIETLTTNDSMQKAVVQALYQKEAVVRIRQDSATSRELLSALIHYGETSKRIQVLTPTGGLANTINDSTHKTPQSLWQWLAAIGKPPIAQTLTRFNQSHQDDHRLPFFSRKKERELFIVDDVQRVSPKELEQFLDIASRRDAKIILLEKPMGLQGMYSDVSTLMDKARVKTFEITHATQAAISVQLLEQKNNDERLLASAKHYANWDVSARRDSHVLTASKAEAVLLNQLIREQLKNQGELSHQEKTIQTLSPVYLTEVEKKRAKSYQPGWVIFQSTNSEMKKLTVLSVCEQDNRLMVVDRDGVSNRLFVSQMDRKTQVYEPQSLTIAKGDWLMATGRLNDLKAGSAVEVAALTRHGMTLKSGKRTHHCFFAEHEQLPLMHRYAKSLHTHDMTIKQQTLLTLPAYALRKNTLSVVMDSSQTQLTIVTDDVAKAQHYAKRIRANTTVIDLTLDAAVKLNPALQNDAPTASLDSQLKHAVSQLTAEKSKLTESEQALLSVTEHLAEREAAFSQFDLYALALKQSMGKVAFSSLETTLVSLIDKGHLIQARSGILTTPQAIALETQLLENVRTGKGAVMPLLTSDEAIWHFNAANLTAGQRDACHLITTTRDRFVMIQGYAGTGKTTMTKTAIDAIGSVKNTLQQDINIVAVAPTHQAVNEIRALGIDAQTLKRFLIDQGQTPTLQANTLVLLDESSMVGNQDYAALTQLIHQQGARCVMLGDIAQHQAIDSGKPSALLLKEGSLAVAYMDEIVRQKSSAYKSVVETLMAGKTDKALAMLADLPLTPVTRLVDASRYSSLHHSVAEVSSDKDAPEGPWLSHTPRFDKINHDSLIDVAVNDYLSRTSDCREQTIVVIHENNARDVANHRIRAGLIEQQVLGIENEPFSRLMGTNVSAAELCLTDTYEACLQKSADFYLKKDNLYYRVQGVDQKTGIVELRHDSGKTLQFLPEKVSDDARMALFEKKSASISLGEKIHFKTSEPSLERFANQSLQVVAVNTDSMIAMDKAGKSHRLDKKSLSDSHWDYSYTATSYSIQGASAQFVIGVEDTTNPKSSHFRSFYITATRGVMHAMIYTNSYDKLKERLHHHPDKYSALEQMGALNAKPHLAPKDDIQPKTIRSNLKPQILDAREISEHLSCNAEHVVETLLGAPNTNMSSKNEYRYGKKGSLSIAMGGENRGTWFDFETSESGNLLHLIQRTLNLDFKSALTFAAKLTGDDLNLERPKVADIPKEKKREGKTNDYALKIAKESQPMHGTLAEKYLTQHRAILTLTSADIRFHPNVYSREEGNNQSLPALVAIARDKDHNIRAVQTIYLDQDTAAKANRTVSKRTFSSIEGAAVILNKGQHAESVTYIAEGIETALSIQDAVKHERVLAVLGKQNFASIDTNLLTKHVVLCLDNDGKDIAQDKLINKAIQRLQEQGKTVAIAYPLDPGDFNDIAQRSGVNGVVIALKQATIPAQINEDRRFLASNEVKIVIDNQAIKQEMGSSGQERSNMLVKQDKSLEREIY